MDPRREERSRVHQPALARRLAPWRLRFRPSGPRQGPDVPQVVPRGGADPRAVGDGGRGGHLRGAGVERHPVVRGRRGPGRHRALLVRVPAGHAAAADGVGGVEAVGGLLQPGLAVRGVGHAVVAHGRELQQLHRRPGVPRRQVLRPARPRRHHQGRRLHPRPGEARAAQARRDQARPPRHARHAHLLLRGRTGQDPARRPRPMSFSLVSCVPVPDGRNRPTLFSQPCAHRLHQIITTVRAFVGLGWGSKKKRQQCMCVRPRLLHFGGLCEPNGERRGSFLPCMHHVKYS